MKTLPLLGMLALGACAVAPHESLLSQAEAKCAIYPSDPHCHGDLQELRMLVSEERAAATAQNNAAAAGALLGILAITAVAADAALSEPTYVVVPAYRRWR